MVAHPPTPFLRSWWLHHVAEGEPSFVLVVAGERLLGGMALQHDRLLGVNRWQSLGSGRLVPDHLQVLVAEGARAEVEAALRTWCRRQGPAIFDLEGLTPDSGFHRILPGAVRRVEEEPSPNLSLSTPEEVVARLPGRMRSTVRRARKKLTAADVTHRLVPPDELDAALDRLHELHERRWADGSGFLSSFDRFAAAARAGSAAGDVLFHELRCGDEVVAVQVDLRTADRVSFFQAGRDTDSQLPSLGTVLLATAIEHACRTGASDYDLLRGRQPYKRDWATAERPVVRLRSAIGVRARMALGLTVGRERLGPLKGRLRRKLENRWQARRTGSGTRAGSNG